MVLPDVSSNKVSQMWKVNNRTTKVLPRNSSNSDNAWWKREETGSYKIPKAFIFCPSVRRITMEVWYPIISLTFRLVKKSFARLNQRLLRNTWKMQFTMNNWRSRSYQQCHWVEVVDLNGITDWPLFHSLVVERIERERLFIPVAVFRL